MASKIKLMVILAALVVFGATFAQSAFAECGPGFSSKSQLIQIVKQNPSIAHGMRKELLAEPKSEYSADETVLNYLREQGQKVFNAPAGYKLKTNTYCPGGFGDYHPYGGLLGNMPGKPLLWHCNKDGKCVPLLKGYCMNFVTGKAVQKRSPKPHKCKCRKPKKHKHHKKPKKPAPTCSTKSPNGGGGNCGVVAPVTNPKQECEANNHSSTGCTQTTIVNAPYCGNVNNGDSTNVNQGGNCNNGGTETCVGQNNCSPHEEETCVNNSCNVTPPPEEPCGCTPEEPEEPEKPEPPSIKITGKTELNMIPAGKTSGDFYINVYASKSGGVLTVDPGIGSVSSCNSSTPESTITTSVPSGASKECVIFYAPEDGDKPPTMTVTMTANLGSASDEATETFKITYPTRPE